MRRNKGYIFVEKEIKETFKGKHNFELKKKRKK